METQSIQTESLPSQAMLTAAPAIPKNSALENPVTNTGGFFLRFFLDVAHRAGCLAILAALIGIVVLAMAKPERQILAIAFGGALLAAAIAGAIWLNAAVPDQRRREARNIVIMAIVVLALTSMLMAFGHIAEKSRESDNQHATAISAAISATRADL
jgi:drug/metabolite transporter (DMT)-like permease